MDETGAKPSHEPKGVPTTMKQMKEMMETMCCSGELGPAEMCRRMMRTMGRTSDTKAQSAPESGTTSDERGRSGEDEGSRG